MAAKEVELHNIAPIATSTTITPQTAPKQAKTGDIEQMIRQAAAKYRVDADYMVRIAKCESGMNAKSVNYGYNENGYPSGVYQHLSGYYPARAAKYGYSTDVFDAYSNINTTAAMFSEGLQYLWECR